MSARRSRPRDEHGVAIVVAISLVAVLVLVASVTVGTVAIVLAHRRAQVAADLASLAGAAALQRGGDACATAARITTLHQVTMTACETAGSSVLVVTTVHLLAALDGADVSARARAGPAGSLAGYAGQE
jgi:secretion/DNA translocation related TadE-like protein